MENDVKQKPGPQRKMRLVAEFLLVFMRLRLGLLEQNLAQRFCVSVSTVLRVLITWYNVLAVHLKHLIVAKQRSHCSQYARMFQEISQTVLY